MTTSPNTPAASEKLATEAIEQNTEHLDLLRPVGQIRAYERLAILAGAVVFQKYFDAEGLDLENIEPAALREMADFAKGISQTYAVDDASRDKLEFLNLTDYLETVFSFVSLLGE